LRANGSANGPRERAPDDRRRAARCQAPRSRPARTGLLRRRRSLHDDDSTSSDSGEAVTRGEAHARGSVAVAGDVRSWGKAEDIFS